eukprot:gene687-9060_t
MAALHKNNRTFRAGDRSQIGDTVYADDTTLLSSSWETAKASWHRYVDVVGRFGLTVAFSKTKVLTAGRDDSGGMLLAAAEPPQRLPARWLCIEGVTSFNLVGSTVQADGGYETEVAHRLRSAGAAWARLRPTCFSGPLLGPARRFSLFRVFVLSRLLYGAELWRLPAALLRRIEHFYNACLRNMAGYNRWTMRAQHVSDARIRSLLGAPALLDLLDRTCLRWAGHCARMSADRLPLQLLSAEVAQALRRSGIARDLWWDAAQEAGKWRGRLRRGWRRNPATAAEDSDNSNAADCASGDDGSAADDAGAAIDDDWPCPSDFVAHRR